MNEEKARRLELVLRRKSGEDKFNELLVGTEEILNEYKGTIGELVSDALKVCL